MQAFSIGGTARYFDLHRMVVEYLSRFVFCREIQGVFPFKIFFIDDVCVDGSRVADAQNFPVHFYGEIEWSVVVGQRFYIAFGIAVIVDDPRMIFEFHALPSVYGVCVDRIADANVFDDTALVIK